jgi:hypothetical protein
MGKDEGGIYKEAVSIKMYASADAVAEPGAVGQPLAFVASKGIDNDVKDLANLTLEELKETRPELYDAIIAEGKGQATPGEEIAPTPVGVTGTVTGNADEQKVTSLIESLTTAQQNFTAMQNSMLVQGASAMLESRLSVTQLPANVRAEIRKELGAGESIFTESQITEAIDKYDRIASSFAQDNDSLIRLREDQIIPFGGSVSSGQITPLQQVSASLDDFFGAPVDEALKGKFPKIRSFAEAYRQITGDYEVNGMYDKRRSVLGDMWFRNDLNLREALPGAAHVVGGATITMPGLMGTSMNKALFNMYQGQNRWWEPLVTKTDLNNMKQQDRIRLANFGSLTQRTVDGAEYTELDWNSVLETYSPNEFGNVVTIGRIAIINDDLKGIQNIPRLLAQSAVVTINEQVAALFTANAGNGPTLADTVQVFNAASHQGNRVTLPLTRANVIAARTIIQKMNNDAGKRIGLEAKWLVVPVDLETDAFELITSNQVPDSANNAPNILANSSRGLSGVVVVPQFTDTNNWYLMAAPSQITGIEVGFLYGREEPELFMQTDPATGMVFTNDVMAHKIRWDFGMDWLDYRGAVASIN